MENLTTDLSRQEAVPATLACLDSLGDQARVYLDAARSLNTHRAYRADWQHFSAWCTDSGRSSQATNGARPRQSLLYT